MTRKDIGSMPDFQVEKLIEFIGTNKKIVEIGTYRGKTARVMAEAGNEVICIDPFEGGYSEDRASQELSEQNDVKKTFLENTKGLNVALIEEFSHDAIKTFNEEIDILIIDGCHEYDSVVKDMEWIKFVKKGGTFIFHDYGSRHKGVQLAVDEVIVPKYKHVFKSCSLMGYEK